MLPFDSRSKQSPVAVAQPVICILKPDGWYHERSVVELFPTVYLAIHFPQLPLVGWSESVLGSPNALLMWVLKCQSVYCVVVAQVSLHSPALGLILWLASS